jgi:hypothetical protein
MAKKKAEKDHREVAEQVEAEIRQSPPATAAAMPGFVGAGFDWSTLTVDVLEALAPLFAKFLTRRSTAPKRAPKKARGE